MRTYTFVCTALLSLATALAVPAGPAQAAGIDLGLVAARGDTCSGAISLVQYDDPTSGTATYRVPSTGALGSWSTYGSGTATGSGTRALEVWRPTAEPYRLILVDRAPPVDMNFTGLATFALSPAVPVQAGDLLGFENVGDTVNCFAATTGTVGSATAAPPVPVGGTADFGLDGGYALDISAQMSATSPNLITDPGAEAATGSHGTVVPVPGWHVGSGSSFTAVTYATGQGYPTAGSPGPPNRGKNFFAGGNGPSTAGTQRRSVSPYATSIDAGHATFALSGYLGGFATQHDRAELTVQFLSSSGAVLRTATLGPVTVQQRHGKTGLLLRTATGAVPPGTRTALVRLSMTRIEGTSNDGYADALSLVLTTF